MKSMKTLLFGGALVILAAGVPTAAQAQASPIPRPIPSKLLLTFTDNTLKVVTKTATLACDPDGGSHPTPTAACDRLREVNGDFSKLRPRPGTICPAVYSPVTVTASGTWRGKTVSFKKTYGNRCELDAATKPIFGF